MISVVEKKNRGGIYHAINRYAKANDKYMKDYDKKIKNLLILNIGVEITYMVGQCRKSFV